MGVSSFRVIRRAIHVSDRDVTRLRQRATRARRIFNPDSKRVQATLRRNDSLVVRVESWLRQARLLRKRTMTNPVVLHSRASCKQQQWHYDYDPDAVRAARVKPFGVILAVQDGTKFETPHESLRLSRGDVLLFRGDVLHAGAAYDIENTRLHAYLDVEGVSRPRNRTWLVDRP